jgi:predicted Fe-Mo cluster-binding NifX family protein
MKKVAIPVVQGRLSEYFGHCNHYEIFEIEGNEIQSNAIEMPPCKDLTKLPEWAAQQGITDIIVYKVDKRIISLFSRHKINLFVGIAINTPQNLIEDYLSGRLRSDEKIIQKLTN